MVGSNGSYWLLRGALARRLSYAPPASAAYGVRTFPALSLMRRTSGVFPLGNRQVCTALVLCKAYQDEAREAAVRRTASTQTGSAADHGPAADPVCVEAVLLTAASRAS